VLHLFDTALGRVAPLELRRSGEVSIYLCGPTVYGEPHLGHGRLSLVWDVMRRYLTWSGLEVRFVSNVTDIEDKIIAQAEEEGRSAEEVAAHYEALWWQTMERLGVKSPDEAPHATSYVGHMVALVEELLRRGSAYRGGDGVYFSVESVPGYGLLAHQPLSSLKAGARVEVSEGAGKRSPMDFALWKAAKPGEPAWDSPWGPGRPGWHTECVVMSLDLLGESFDLHGGGSDLIFPHHENERAQALALGKQLCRRWAHSGMLTMRGEKMSKSLGNTVSLKELLDAHDPRALRLLVLQSHYRGPMEVTEEAVAAAERAVRRLDSFAREFACAREAVPDEGAVARFKDAMDDDFDTPRALAGIFELLPRARSSGSAPLASAVFQMCQSALGLMLRFEGIDLPEEVAAKAAERDAARKAKDWARADAIRAELQAAGWVVEDGPEGTLIRRP
jgi:cysteinyl-tRNA synthetase